MVYLPVYVSMHSTYNVGIYACTKNKHCSERAKCNHPVYAFLIMIMIVSDIIDLLHADAVCC